MNSLPRLTGNSINKESTVSSSNTKFLTVSDASGDPREVKYATLEDIDGNINVGSINSTRLQIYQNETILSTANQYATVELNDNTTNGAGEISLRTYGGPIKIGNESSSNNDINLYARNVSIENYSTSGLSSNVTINGYDLVNVLCPILFSGLNDHSKVGSLWQIGFKDLQTTADYTHFTNGTTLTRETSVPSSWTLKGLNDTTRTVKDVYQYSIILNNDNTVTYRYDDYRKVNPQSTWKFQILTPILFNASEFEKIHIVLAILTSRPGD